VNPAACTSHLRRLALLAPRCLGTVTIGIVATQLPVAARAASLDSTSPAPVAIREVLVDGHPQQLSSAEPTRSEDRNGAKLVERAKLGRLRLSARTQRFEIRFGPDSASPNQPIRFRYQLERIDRDWQEAGGEMRLTARFLDAAQNTVAAADFVARGQSPGWSGNFAGSAFAPRLEKITVPAQAAALQIELFSGGDEQTTGAMAINDLSVSVVDTNGKPRAVLFSSLIDDAKDLEPTLEVPRPWMRDGSKPSIARVLKLNGIEPRRALSVVDTDATKWGAWRTASESPISVRPGDSLNLAWNEMYSIGWGGTRTVGYSFLPPGEYQFRVRAVTEMGEWIGEAAALAITVPLPFWRTGWFLGSSLALAVAALVAGVRYVTWRKMEGRLEILERQRALERERARIARDLHDDLGASLTQIALLSELAKADLEDPKLATAHLNQIFAKTGTLARQLNEIVWAVNPANDTLEHFTSHICKFAQDYLSLAGIRCRLDVPESVPSYAMHSSDRHNLFLTAKEALHNIVKHAHAGQVWLRLRLEPGRLTLLIEDDGKGGVVDALANAAGHASGNGLSNMQKRMEQLGGQYSQQSRPDSGTSVRLECPLRKS